MQSAHLLFLFCVWLVSVCTADVHEASIRRFFKGETVLPLTMYAFDAGGSTLVTDLQTGSPPRFRRYVLAAIEGPTVLLNYDPRMQRHQFESALVNQEIFEIAGQRLVLPYVTDPAAVASFNCSTCEGVIPIGKGSLLWNGFDDVSISANWIVFGSDDMARAVAFERMLVCKIPDTALCTVQGQFLGVTVPVQFGFRTYKTLIPNSLFQAYVDLLHPDVNDVSEWEDIVIELSAEDENGNPTIAEIVIEARHVVGEHLGMPNALTIAPHDGDTIILGSDVLRSLVFFWNRSSGTAAINRIRTNRGYSAYAIFAMFVFLAILFYERKGTLVFQATPEFYKKLGRRATVRFFVDALILSSPGVALLNMHIWPILGEEPFLLIISIVAYAYYGLWALITGILMWVGRDGNVAWTDAPWNIKISVPPESWTGAGVKPNYNALGIETDKMLRKGLARVTAARRASYDSLILLAMFLLSIETRLYDFCGFMTVAVSIFWMYVVIEASILFWYLLRRRTQQTAWWFYISWIMAAGVLWLVLWAYVFTPAMFFFVPATPYLGFLSVLAATAFVSVVASVSARVLLYDYWTFKQAVDKKIT